jgi:hypothetical protein
MSSGSSSSAPTPVAPVSFDPTNPAHVTQMFESLKASLHQVQTENLTLRQDLQQAQSQLPSKGKAPDTTAPRYAKPYKRKQFSGEATPAIEEFLEQVDIQCEM